MTGAPSARLWYHATDTTAKAESIMASGLVPGRASAYKGGLATAKGAVYLSAKLHRTLDYLMGHDGDDFDYSDRPSDPYGYLFGVEESALANYLPDEDALASFVSHRVRREDGKHVVRMKDGDGDDAAALIEAIRAALSPVEMDAIVFTRSRTTPAKMGKKIQKVVPRRLQMATLESDPRIAHFGTLVPSSCWRIRRSDSALIGVGERMFEFAEAVPLDDDESLLGLGC
jgi:hypothetical protein